MLPRIMRVGIDVDERGYPLCPECRSYVNRQAHALLTVVEQIADREGKRPGEVMRAFFRTLHAKHEQTADQSH